MIAEFYENCEIFITGGSGVVGKAAIEKLLRSCNVKKIYVLLRCKRDVCPEQRLVDMKNSKIFDHLKKQKPHELDKLVAISGDIGKAGLGISPDDREQLKNVSVFFHSAATTRFNEPLKTAIRINLKSTLEALKLAETMRSLRIFVHVSTYFSNPYVRFVEDKVYPPLFDWRSALKLVDTDYSDEVVDTITEKVITDFQNTYLFTKHLAEQIVDEYRFKLPVCIFKPSIVIQAIEEPEPGFTESASGIMGITAIWGTGLLQALQFDNPSIRMDLTPLDLGSKALLMFTALRGQLPREKFIEATPVGKFSSTAVVTTPFIELCDILTKAVHKYPAEKSFWIPTVTLTTCPLLYSFLVVFLQIIPSILVDSILTLCGKKPFMMSIQRRAYITKQVLEFFMRTQFHSDGVTDYEELRRIGKGTEFSMDALEKLGKNAEFRKASTYDMATGCRKFILNEPESNLEHSRKVLRAKKIAYNILKGFFGFFAVRAMIRVGLSYVGY